MNTHTKFNSDNRSGDRIWMVVYTKSKWEKKAHFLLNLQGIESFCPLVKIKRKWADRMKMIEQPLFSSYLFVFVNQLEQQQVLQTSGIMNFIYHCGKPAAVPSSDIERIKNMLDRSDLESVNVRNFRAGDEVIFNDGILFDFHGEVLELQGKSILIILKQLDCALIAKIKVKDQSLLFNRDITYNKLLTN